MDKLIIPVLVLIIVGLVTYIFFNKTKKLADQPTFLGNLEWRRAVKHFADGPVDTGPIEKAVIAAPSSFGLQPYKVIIVTDKEKKAVLYTASYNQTQVEECHSLMVFCALKDIDKRIQEYVDQTGLPAETIVNFMKGVPDKVAWAKQQTTIALGFALAAAAEKKITTCPMEGFEPLKVSKILELDSNLIPVAFLAVGLPDLKEEITPKFRFSDTLQNIE